jgi:uncharacterized coiled-coil DUF342 family protein
MVSDVPLKEYLSGLLEAHERMDAQRFEASERALSAALQSTTDALKLANENLIQWKHSQNEWRAAQNDLTRTFISRPELDTKVESLHEKVDSVMHRLDKLEGASGGLRSAWIYLMGAISVVASIVATWAIIHK